MYALLIRVRSVFKIALTLFTSTTHFNVAYSYFFLNCPCLFSNMAKGTVDLQGPSFQLLVNEFANIAVPELDDPWMRTCRLSNISQGIMNAEALNALLKLAIKLLN